MFTNLLSFIEDQVTLKQCVEWWQVCYNIFMSIVPFNWNVGQWGQSLPSGGDDHCIILKPHCESLEAATSFYLVIHVVTQTNSNSACDGKCKLF